MAKQSQPTSLVRVAGRDLPISPRKLRLVIDAVRGQNLVQALSNLQFMNKKAASLAHKVMKQAVAAAEEQRLSSGELVVLRVQADLGQALKRRLIGSRGKTSVIKKQRSHLTIVVGPARSAEKPLSAPRSRIMPTVKAEKTLSETQEEQTHEQSTSDVEKVT